MSRVGREAVVATSRYIAEHVVVDYNDLEPIMDIRTALHPTTAMPNA